MSGLRWSSNRGEGGCEEVNNKLSIRCLLLFGYEKDSFVSYHESLNDRCFSQTISLHFFCFEVHFLFIFFSSVCAMLYIKTIAAN